MTTETDKGIESAAAGPIRLYLLQKELQGTLLPVWRVLYKLFGVSDNTFYNLEAQSAKKTDKQLTESIQRNLDKNG